MNTISNWHPTWWKKDVHGSAWERVKEALERDWTQTKHELGIGGHELNQNIADTAKQATGAEPLPTINQANPPKVIGAWNEAELPYGYGYAARSQFGSMHPQWTPELEAELRKEWSAEGHGPIDWNVAKPLVRRGYEHDDRAKTAPGNKG